MAGRQAELLFGESEVLLAALHLLGLPGVTQIPEGPVSYIRIMFDQHPIVQSNGASTESYQAARRSLRAHEARMPMCA